ncbi:hypothetical protein NDU88_006855 [Pleurodeles waltl]|uniref:Uncharacterized protein n=1 Tax=Pleurodeles waltl TaxID=8319 RepID=A0AAV7U1R9_PLEWA|nr:hypothetical protein NDU88_006855 [Pleurodeles waltl]
MVSTPVGATGFYGRPRFPPLRQHSDWPAAAKTFPPAKLLEERSSASIHPTGPVAHLGGADLVAPAHIPYTNKSSAPHLTPTLGPPS